MRCHFHLVAKLSLALVYIYISISYYNDRIITSVHIKRIYRKLITKSDNMVIGYFSKGTKVLMADGSTKIIEDILSGDKVISKDGQPRMIKNVSCDVSHSQKKMYEVSQATQHKCKDIYGNISFTCNASYILLMRTKQRVNITNHSLRGKDQTSVIYFQLDKIRDKITGREYEMVKLHTKSFQHTTHGSEASEYKARQFADSISKKCITWTVEAQDAKNMSYHVRRATQQFWVPILMEKATLASFIEEHGFDATVTPYVAYLLGLWVGDGYSNKVTYSIDALDIELIDRIREYANKIDLEAVTMSYHRNRDTSVTLYVEKIRGYGIRRNLNTGNLLWDMINAFGFKNNKIPGKAVPEFLTTESFDIREQFLAGLIDSDGHVKKDLLSATVKTIYPEVREGLTAVARSLGIRTSVHTTKAAVTNGVSRKESYDIYMSGSSPLESVLCKCSLSRKAVSIPSTLNRTLQTFNFELKEVEANECYGIVLENNMDRHFMLANQVVVHDYS